MEVLVGWDTPNEAETIELLLNVGDIRARVTTELAEFVRASAVGCWDAHSRLLLYSDGLADAFPAGAQPQRSFGEEGIRSTLRATARRSLDEALDQLFTDSNAFTQGGGRHDDTSVVLVEQTGDAGHVPWRG